MHSECRCMSTHHSPVSLAMIDKIGIGSSRLHSGRWIPFQNIKRGGGSSPIGTAHRNDYLAIVSLKCISGSSITAAIFNGYVDKTQITVSFGVAVTHRNP